LGSFGKKMAEASTDRGVKRKVKPVEGVVNSSELQRILGLPRRDLDVNATYDVTPLFAKPYSRMQFWPIQSAMLVEASKANGLFAPVAVGAGKTLTTLALPEALDSEKAVLLVPPQLKKQLAREIAKYSAHFYLPTKKLTIVAYSELSSAKKADILEELEPDLIIADEAHNLRHKNSARTKRFLRYMKAHPECRFAALSGTMTTRSIKDYQHLIELALRKNSPLPGNWRELVDWAGAIDVNPEEPKDPGALLKLCRAGEHVRSGFRRRLVETPGVVATEETALGTSLIVKRITCDVPDEVQAIRNQVLKTWSIEEEEFEDAMALSRCLRQISCGFYYRWAWPGGEPDREWLEARKEWHREVRQFLATQARPGMDSPHLLALAAQQGRWASDCWAAWAAVKDRPKPPTEAVWLSDFMIRAVEKRVFAHQKRDRNLVIWYEHRALGDRLACDLKLPLYDAKRDASEATEPVIVASIKAHGTGKNLQRYAHNLITTFPPNGTVIEQLFGRTHRPGQLADEVVQEWFGHTPDLVGAYAKAIDDAEYMEQTTGQRQKLLYAQQVD
jgi:hypothetical protein